MEGEGRNFWPRYGSTYWVPVNSIPARARTTCTRHNMARKELVERRTRRASCRVLLLPGTSHQAWLVLVLVITMRGRGSGTHGRSDN